ncbi:MAG: haloacid dehalogenase type II [Acidiferrobacterales bacterium]|nr:haloacid dehalogenase type II [Acidiferrobacterales bacterium]
MQNIRALLFDVFGTVVDWRSSIIDEGAEINRCKNLNVNWADFVDEWRGLYQPSMEAVRTGKRPWTILDVLHRESLDQLMQKYQIIGWTEAEIVHLNNAWHRLTPWPDSSEGLYRLKKKYTIGTCSNGNVALIVDMAKHSDLPWDMVLGAEVTGHYKKQPEAYLTSVEMLGLTPEQVVMVAAHNDDLYAAEALGLKTAFVARATEYGPHQKKDLVAEKEWNYVASDFLDLAAQLNA